MKKTSARFIIATILAVLGIVNINAKEKQSSDNYEESYNYLRGVEAYNNENYDEAESYFLKEVDNHPQNGYALYWLGYIYYDRNEYGKSLSCFNKSIKSLKNNKASAVAYDMRADVYIALGDTVKALKDYSEAIKIDPEYGTAYKDRAQRYYELGQYDLSDADYDKLIELDDGNAFGYMGKARNANTRKDYNSAIELLNHVILLQEDYGQAYSFRAESYIGLKDFNNAANDIINAIRYNDNKVWYLLALPDKDIYPLLLTKLKIEIKKEPQNSLWPYVTAFYCKTNKNYEEAIKYFIISNKLEEEAVTYYFLSGCYASLGDYETALKNTDKALELNSDDSDYLIDKAGVLDCLGRKKDAISFFDKVIEKTPDYEDVYYLKGLVEESAKMNEEAIEDYSMNIALYPEHAYAYCRRAKLYMAENKKDEAVADYEKTIELDTVPNNYSIAMFAFLDLGRKQEAIDFMERVIANDTTNVGNYYNGACFYSKLGDNEKAIEMLRKSLDLGFANFNHISEDPDLDAIRNLPEFISLVNEYREKTEKRISKLHSENRDDKTYHEETVEVPFTKESGVTKVKCDINGLPLYFVFDTGAANVSLSLVEANFMLKNDYLSKSDFIGSQGFVDANGDISVGSIINLKKVSFGGLELKNVRASVVKNQKAPLLLGQSVLSRLGKVEIDNAQMKLKITGYIEKD